MGFFGNNADTGHALGESWAPLTDRSQQVQLGPDTTVFDVGSPCENFLFLQNGSVRVQAHAGGGREILLYRVRANESCVLTTSCLLAHESYPAEGVTETEVSALMLSKTDFFDGLDASADFRRLVFTAYARRLCSVIQRLQEITASRVDTRLASTLLELSVEHPTQPVHITQQAVAIEVGTSREVISRELHRFQSNGWVETGRGEITIIDRTGLENIALK